MHRISAFSLHAFEHNDEILGDHSILAALQYARLNKYLRKFYFSQFNAIKKYHHLIDSK